MLELTELVSYLDHFLKLDAFSADHSNNGLQVEGAALVTKAVFGVDASLALFQQAAEQRANFIFVHHGLSWGAEPKRLTGVTAKRYQTLFANNMSLYGVHLPLDAHAKAGNNAILANMIELENRIPFFRYDGVEIGFIGDLPRVVSAAKVAECYAERLGRAKFLFRGDCEVKRVAVISGGAGTDGLAAAVEAKADLLVTGEITHCLYPLIQESPIAVIGLGHYVSETTGPRAVMRHVQEKFQLPCSFIELPTDL